MRTTLLALATLLLSSAGSAQTDEDFTDGKNDAKVHTASHFACPKQIGLFERDAVGEKDSESNADFCAYSALDGTYGTVTLTPVSGSYDLKASLADDFAEQEGIGAQKTAEGMLKAGTLAIYTRTYETSKLESLHYKIMFSGAAVGNWAVETTIEYAEPRDNAAQKQFLDTIYAEALKDIGTIPVAPAQPQMGTINPVSMPATKDPKGK